jgi:hypothetical protein
LQLDRDTRPDSPLTSASINAVSYPPLRNKISCFIPKNDPKLGFFSFVPLWTPKNRLLSFWRDPGSKHSNTVWLRQISRQKRKDPQFNHSGIPLELAISAIPIIIVRIRCRFDFARITYLAYRYSDLTPASARCRPCQPPRRAPAAAPAPRRRRAPAGPPGPSPLQPAQRGAAGAAQPVQCWPST